MIEPIPGLPANVLGFRAKGTVTGADYESVVVPAVEAALSSRKPVRMIYHLGEDFSGFEAAALWQDARVGLKHFSAWERIALVTDIEWIRAATKAFGFMMHGEVRAFRNSELAPALEWIVE